MRHRPVAGRLARENAVAEGRSAGDALEPVPARPGVGADRRAGDRRQGRQRRRLRGPLLLGHGDVRRPVPLVHPAGGGPSGAALPLADAADRPAAGAALNQAGALYPWRTINGEEASAYYAAGTAQYHINADIAFALKRYVDASGDIAFLAGDGAEILMETARLWNDLGFYSNRGETQRQRRRHGRVDVPHPRRHRPRRVHGRGQRQPVHERDGAVQPALRGPGARAARRLGARRLRRGRATGRPRRGRGRGMDQGRRVDVPALRRRARHPPAGRRLPRPRAVGLRAHAARQVPAAAPLPPARDLPPPGAQAGRRRAGDVAAQRPVLDRRAPAQLRLLRPDHHRRLVAVGVRPGDGRRPDRLRRARRPTTSARRCSSTSPTSTATPATASTSRRPEACGERSCSGSPACSRPARRSASIPSCPTATADDVPGAAPRLAHARRARRRRLHRHRRRRRCRSPIHTTPGWTGLTPGACRPRADHRDVGGGLTAGGPDASGVDRVVLVDAGQSLRIPNAVRVAAPADR